MILALVLALSSVEGLLAQAVPERILATLPEGTKLGEVFVTADGGQAAYSLHDGKKTWAVWRQGRSKPFDILHPSALSADGRHLLYVTANTADAGVNRLWLDDREIQVLDFKEIKTLNTRGALSSDGSVAVLMVGHEGSRSYSVNGKLGARHPLKHLQTPKISADGRVIAGQGTTEGDRFRVVINDVLGPAYENMAGPDVSEKGVVAYVGEKADGSLALHHGDKVSTLDGLLPEDVFISADGTKLGYVLSDKGWFVRVGAKTSPKVKRILLARFDPRGEKAVFWGLNTADKYVVGVDDRLFDTPDLVSPPQFSFDGSKVGYAAQIGRALLWKVIDLSK